METIFTLFVRLAKVLVVTLLFPTWVPIVIVNLSQDDERVFINVARWGWFLSITPAVLLFLESMNKTPALIFIVSLVSVYATVWNFSSLFAMGKSPKPISLTFSLMVPFQIGMVGTTLLAVQYPTALYATAILGIITLAYYIIDLAFHVSRMNPKLL